MRSSRSSSSSYGYRVLIGSMLLAALFTSTTARGGDDCPPGSVHKTQDSFGWCEPTICATDGQCSPSEVCRPVPLCMEVGTLADAATGDAGKRLVVTQRCAPDRTCPQKQTCSDLSRCVSKQAAEKMGILAAGGASAGASATPPSSGDAKKSSCGCDVVGARTGSGALAAIGLAFTLLALRRRR